MQYWNYLLTFWNSQSKSDLLFYTQSRVLQTDWLMLEYNSKQHYYHALSFSVTQLPSPACHHPHDNHTITPSMFLMHAIQIFKICCYFGNLGREEQSWDEEERQGHY